MSANSGSNIVQRGLVFSVDAKNPKSISDSNFYVDNIQNTVSVSVASTITDIGHTWFNFTQTTETSFNPIDKYAITLTFIGKPSATPIMNYRSPIRLIDTANYTYYTMDTRELATPYCLIYVKDFSLSAWDSMWATNTAEYNSRTPYIFTLVIKNGSYDVYRDGILRSNTPITVDLSGYGNITKLQLNSGGSNPYYMQYVSMYNRILTPAEIMQNYLALKSRINL